MTHMTRISTLAISALVTAVLGGLGCSSSNPPATQSSVGGSASDATGGAESMATGGDTSMGAQGGSSSVDGAGGSTDTGATGGTTGAPDTSQFQPLCNLPTVAGPTPAKGGLCAPADQQLCYKTCGPQSIGFKSETCDGVSYVEQSGCSFPVGPTYDYSCFKIPTTIDSSCPTDAAPQASQPCTVATCTLCNLNGQYLDSGGNPKTGYCVCPAPGTSGTSKWSCASTTAWPCPAGAGC